MCCEKENNDLLNNDLLFPLKGSQFSGRCPDLVLLELNDVKY